MATNAIGDERPTLFLRKATGLVRGWSVRDSMIYACLSTNVITLGLVEFAYQDAFPSGQLLTAVLISGVWVSFLVLAYSGLVVTIPRAGGDYVWQSRILGSGIGFVMAATGWWFILWLWAPIYGSVLSEEFFQPLWATFNDPSGAAWFGTPTGGFVVTLITIALAGLLVSLGMSGYAKVQKWCFYGGLLGVAIIVILLLVYNQQVGLHLGLQHARRAQAVRDQERLRGHARGRGQQDDRVHAAVVRRDRGVQPVDAAGPDADVLPAVAELGHHAVRRGPRRERLQARVQRHVLRACGPPCCCRSSCWRCSPRRSGSTSTRAPTRCGSTRLYGMPSAHALPIFPYPVLLVGWLVNNTAFQVILILLMSLWFFGWVGTLFLSSTRVIFAAAFDRILPDGAAPVSEKRRVPVWSLVLMLLPAVGLWRTVLLQLAFHTYTLDATLVIAVTYLFSAIAVVILPFASRTCGAPRRPRG